MSESHHLVITVHGIRTFGNWQERLEKLLKAEDTSIEVFNYKYGYFSVLAFIIPFFRWIATRRFRRNMLQEIGESTWDRVDIVAHSFGTHLVGWGLYGIEPQKCPRLHTIILSGSVLKPGFPWRDLVGNRVRRIVNDCGIHDSVLLLNQLTVLFTGMAGRVGFNGLMSDAFRNRFFEFGHSGYFLNNAKSDDTFMKEKWIPLLTTEVNTLIFDDPRPVSPFYGFITFLFNNTEPIKLLFWIIPLVAGILWINAQRQEAVEQRKVALRNERIAHRRFLASKAEAVAPIWPQRGLLLALESISADDNTAPGEKNTMRLPAAREALRNVLSVVGGIPLLGSKEMELRTVAFDPHGKWIATAGNDKKVRLWNLANLKEDAIVLSGHEGRIETAVFGPQGKWLATVGERAVWLWSFDDLSRDSKLLSEAKSHAGGMVAFGPQGKWLAVVQDLEAQLWALDDLSNDSKVLRGHEAVWDVAFDPQGRWLATAGNDQTVQLWNLDDLNDTPTVLRGHEDGVRAIAFDPQSRWLATASGKTARLWNLEDLSNDPIALHGHEDHEEVVWSIAFNPQGNWLVTRTNKTARLWNLNDLGDDPIALRGHHEDGVWDAAFDPQGRWLAMARGRTVRLWRLSNLTDEPIDLRGHEGLIYDIAFDRQGTWLATAGWDQTARLWNLDELNNDPVVLRGPPSLYVHEDTVVFDAQGRWLVITGWEPKAWLWNLDDLRRPRVLSLPKGSVNDAAFDPHGEWLATVGGESALLWDLNHLSKDPIVLKIHHGPVDKGGLKVYDSVKHVAFGPHGKWLATASFDKARLWELANLRNAPRVFDFHRKSIHQISFGPHGKWLATASEQVTWLLNLRDLNDDPVGLYGHQGTVFNVAFGPHGNLLATSGSDNTVRLWSLNDPSDDPRILESSRRPAFGPNGKWLAADGAQGVKLWNLNSPSDDPIVLESSWSHAFDLQGRWLAAVGDQALQLWNLNDLREAPIDLHGDEGLGSGVVFDPQGRWIASVLHSNNTVRLWQLQVDVLIARACRTAGRNLTREEWRLYVNIKDRYDRYRLTCKDFREPENYQPRNLFLDSD